MNLPSRLEGALPAVWKSYPIFAAFAYTFLELCKTQRGERLTEIGSDAYSPSISEKCRVQGPLHVAANGGSMRRLRLAMGCAAILLMDDGLLAQEQTAAAVPAAKKVLSPDTFLELRSVQDPQFSPDGTRVAFVVADPQTGEKRTRHIWLYDKQSNTARQLTYSEKSESSPRWSPDGRQLAFLSNRAEQQQVYLLRMEGGEAAALTKGKAGIETFEWSPDGQSIAYLSPNPKTEAEEKKEKDKDDARVVDRDEKYARLRLLDLANREERALTEPAWKVEELQWSPNGQSIVIKATDRPASDRLTDRIYLVNVKDGHKQELLAPRGPFRDLRFALSGGVVSFIGSRDDGPEPHDLQLISVEGGVARNLTGASLDRAILDYHFAKGGWMVAVYADGFHRKFVGYTEEGERKDMTGDLPVNPGQFSVSSAGEIAFVGETATSMQELWLRDTKGVAQQVSHINDSWKAYSLVAPEFFRYKSFDGTEIEAGLLKPAGHDGKTKLPLVVLVHGGPTGNWETRSTPGGSCWWRPDSRSYIRMYVDPSATAKSLWR